ncbi:hypothetical protein EZV62_008787 [Acer yangbiense]|uniref:Uncharacterized protein n=1 Tax=Acer yangbiense TaxID=1000413 RepID=A0A5C7IEX0_9ROSI|nr:hypothetical protein EZV62_008787 [Acer yangbiense]
MGPDLDSIGVVLRHGGGGLLHGEHPQLQLHGYNDVALDDKTKDFVMAGSNIHCAENLAGCKGLDALCSSVDIKHWRVKTKTIASAFVDGEFFTSGSFDQKEISRLNDAKGALHKLSQSIPINVGMVEIFNDMDKNFVKNFEIEGAKQKLHGIC